MTTAQQAYQSLLAELREIGLLSSVTSALWWDQQTQLPPRASPLRADQLSMLARMSHERLTTMRLGDLLSSIEGSELVKDADSDSAVNVRETRRSYDRARKVPPSLVQELSKTAVLGQQAWTQARKTNDFPAFCPWLAKMFDLKRQEAECVGYVSDPYDALLDEFEPGATAVQVRATFESLREPLVELIAKVVASPRKAPSQILGRNYPRAAQEALARQAASAVGFDFSAGRLDVSVHPFCSGLGPSDTRMTTRFDESGFGDAFFSVLHETGHGLYEQGLPPEHFGTPCGQPASLGIHESQSRMWENLVGRGKPFWKFFFAKVQSAFPDALRDVDEGQWYFAVNDIRPSLIRTEADEATYNLHVLLRFELERAILRRELDAADVPRVWNEKMKQYLGVTPPDDASGCMQDIHWSEGLIGYFPTYTLGNLCAAQFFEKVRADLGDLDGAFARGEFSPLLDWLRKNIHSQGKRHSAPQLVARVTGKPLSAEPLLRHLRAKASELYGVH